MDIQNSTLVLKVENGTHGVNDTRLCDTCRSGMIARGSADSEEIVHCFTFEKKIPFKVVQCNRYQNRCTPSLYDMEQLAWMIVTDSKRVKCGFVSPEEFARIERKRRKEDG